MFCPKCGKPLGQDRPTVVAFDRSFSITVYLCHECDQISVEGPDELGMFSKAGNVHQDIGVVGPGSSVTGMVIGSFG